MDTVKYWTFLQYTARFYKVKKGSGYSHPISFTLGAVHKRRPQPGRGSICPVRIFSDKRGSWDGYVRTF